MPNKNAKSILLTCQLSIYVENWEVGGAEYAALKRHIKENFDLNTINGTLIEPLERGCCESRTPNM